MDAQQALQQLQQRLQQSPEDVHLRFQLAYLQMELGEHAAAKINFELVLKKAPDHVDAWVCLSLVAENLNLYPLAFTCHQTALKLKPNASYIHNNLGNHYLMLQQYDKALACYEKAIALDPHSAIACYSKAHCYRDLQQFSLAIPQYQKALALDATQAAAHFNLALAYLMVGEYRLAWPEYEWRWQLDDTKRLKYQLPQPHWRGEDLSGKTIFIHSEQGFGDLLQFARFLPLIKNYHPAKIILGCDKALYSLLKTQMLADEVVCQDETLPKFDVHLPQMSLPYVLGITLANLPKKIPYLNADANSIAHWRSRLKTRGVDFSAQAGKRIAFVWAGSNTNLLRSCSIENFAPLFQIAHTQWLSVQIDGAEAGLKAYPQIHHLGAEIKDFADTAAILTLVDLFITIDTATAHLAGAMGIPTWLLLSKPTDWRWMLERADSEWYPSARLFRQPSYGQWPALFANVQATLLAWLAGDVTSLQAPAWQKAYVWDAPLTS